MGTLKNSRHELFCQSLARGLSAAEAYRTAGFKPNRGRASRLQRESNIKQRVQELLAARTEDERRARELAIKSSSMSLGELLQELSQIASSSISDIVDWDEGGLRVRPKADLTPAQLATIQQISELEFFDKDGRMVSRRMQVKLHDKLSALQKLGMHLGAFEPKNQVTMQQVDQFLRAILVFLERRLGKNELPSAMAELRQLNEEMFGPPQIPDGTTRH